MVLVSTPCRDYEGSMMDVALPTMLKPPDLKLKAVCKGSISGDFGFVGSGWELCRDQFLQIDCFTL